MTASFEEPALAAQHAITFLAARYPANCRAPCNTLANPRPFVRHEGRRQLDGREWPQQHNAHRAKLVVLHRSQTQSMTAAALPPPPPPPPKPPPVGRCEALYSSRRREPSKWKPSAYSASMTATAASELSNSCRVSSTGGRLGM